MPSPNQLSLFSPSHTPQNLASQSCLSPHSTLFSPLIPPTYTPLNTSFSFPSHSSHDHLFPHLVQPLLPFLPLSYTEYTFIHFLPYAVEPFSASPSTLPHSIHLHLFLHTCGTPFPTSLSPLLHNYTFIHIFPFTVQVGHLA